MRVKKRVGILNYQYSNHNYGAVLQASALSEFINKKLGIPAEHIDFIPQMIHLKWHVKLKSKIRSVLMKLGFIKVRLTHELFCNPEIFEKFRCKWLPRSSKTYSSFEELASENFDYSSVVVGSDQVWRASYTGESTEVYFLSFLDDDIKRVSYAASFGNDFWELDESNTKSLLKQVKKFEYVSVREKSGVDICKIVFNVEAKHVLDPTLLVGRDFFDDIISSEGLDELDSGELVYYKLDTDSKFVEFISQLSKDLGVSSKNIYYENIGGKNYYQTVGSWLNDIRNSKYVVTDSFHCVCFAVLFEKPFFYYPNDDRGLTRLESLLSLLGLEKNIYRFEGDPVIKAASLVNIDYKEINKSLGELREESH